jgi:hypothetical protein
MRILLLAVLVACSKTEPADHAASGSAVAASPRADALALDHVTLLYPEAVIATRLPDTDGFAATLKSVGAAVGAYDAEHEGLPADLDAIVVARKGAIRVWLVGPSGDVAIPQLDQTFGKLAAPRVIEGNVGAVATLRRTKATAAREPYLPASWKQAAGKQGGQLDQVIDAVWPR